MEQAIGINNSRAHFKYALVPPPISHHNLHSGGVYVASDLPFCISRARAEQQEETGRTATAKHPLFYLHITRRPTTSPSERMGYIQL